MMAFGYYVPIVDVEPLQTAIGAITHSVRVQDEAGMSEDELAALLRFEEWLDELASSEGFSADLRTYRS